MLDAYRECRETHKSDPANRDLPPSKSIEYYTFNRPCQQLAQFRVQLVEAGEVLVGLGEGGYAGVGVEAAEEGE